MAQKIVDVDSSQSVATTIKELNLPPRPLLILLGDFDPSLNNQVQAICSRVIIPVALDSGALVLDDARSTGCAALIAQAALERDETPQLLALIPSNRPPTNLDPNHSLVLRFPGAWSDNPKLTFQVVDQLLTDVTVSGRVIACCSAAAIPKSVR